MLPIICISILTVLCLYFIWVAKNLATELKEVNYAFDGMTDYALDLYMEREKSKPKRDSKGRFIGRAG